MATGEGTDWVTMPARATARSCPRHHRYTYNDFTQGYTNGLRDGIQVGFQDGSAAASNGNRYGLGDGKSGSGSWPGMVQIWVTVSGRARLLPSGESLLGRSLALPETCYPKKVGFEPGPWPGDPV